MFILLIMIINSYQWYIRYIIKFIIKTNLCIIFNYLNLVIPESNLANFKTDMSLYYHLTDIIRWIWYFMNYGVSLNDVTVH